MFWDFQNVPRHFKTFQLLWSRLKLGKSCWESLRLDHYSTVNTELQKSLRLNLDKYRLLRPLCLLKGLLRPSLKNNLFSFLAWVRTAVVLEFLLKSRCDQITLVIIQRQDPYPETQKSSDATSHKNTSDVTKIRLTSPWMWSSQKDLNLKNKKCDASKKINKRLLLKMKLKCLIPSEEFFSAMKSIYNFIWQFCLADYFRFSRNNPTNSRGEDLFQFSCKTNLCLLMNALLHFLLIKIDCFLHLLYHEIVHYSFNHQMSS
jgi:hypothetical protein